MKPIRQEEIPEVSSLFTGLWNFLKQHYYPETEEDWKALMTAARAIPLGEEGTPLFKLGVSMTAEVVNFIQAKEGVGRDGNG